MARSRTDAVTEPQREVPRSIRLFTENGGPQNTNQITEALAAVMADCVTGRITVKEARRLNARAEALVRQWYGG